MIKIYVISIDSLNDKTVIEWFDLIAYEQQERLKRFRFREDYLRSLAGEAMLRIIVGEKVGVMPKKLNIIRPRGEKPFFADYSGIYFNISHSGKWVICAINDDEIGIDIEEIKDKEVNPSLIRKVLSAMEQEYVEKLDDEQKAKAFYRFWTMKEAYIKYTGQGLRLELDKIEIDVERNLVRLVDSESECSCITKQIDFFDDKYILSICANKDETPLVSRFRAEAWNGECLS
ncbi:MAG: 4'-phosphopantetheinyl transferase superfamily protein [Lachnospiraceae bacterium]|nr:4'-phosphopantetheinyl transferase superfamily protein [Lachnospiraceae bacterium]